MGENLVARLFLGGSSLIFLILGGAHLLATLRDIRRPTYFTPIDDELRMRMMKTGLQISGGRTSIWTAWLGFNLSHGLGVMIFAALGLGFAAVNYGLIVVVPLMVSISIIYFLVSLRFWFNVPTRGIGAATILLVISNVLLFLGG